MTTPAPPPKRAAKTDAARRRVAPAAARMVSAPVAREEPGLINREIGRQIVARRNQLGMTQTDLARRLGVSYQHVQKFEKGSTRIYADMFLRICRILSIEPASLFRGLDGAAVETSEFSEPSASYEAGLFETRDGAALARAWARIESKAVRKRMLDLMNALADEAETDGAAPSG